MYKLLYVDDVTHHDLHFSTCKLFPTQIENMYQYKLCVFVYYVVLEYYTVVDFLLPPKNKTNIAYF